MDYRGKFHGWMIEKLHLHGSRIPWYMLHIWGVRSVLFPIKMFKYIIGKLDMYSFDRDAYLIDGHWYSSMLFREISEMVNSKGKSYWFRFVASKYSKDMFDVECKIDKE